jgi:methylenetetrahydrofolate dehydrogenase (NADP+)/methenyltetrahydrofolate cyclohydrolase
MELINGRKIAQEILDKLKLEVSKLNFQLIFCDVLIGNNAVSLSYVKAKARKAQEIGLDFKILQLLENVSTDEVIENINEIQKNPHLCGLIVQLPLPAQIDKQKVLNAINPNVDVDCLGQVNIEAFYSGRPLIFPPTTAAILEIIDLLKVDLKEKKFLVIGQGDLVGKPITYALKARGLNVSVVDKSTADLKSLTAEADVIISGAGHAQLLTSEFIKPSTILIDAGTAESAGSIVGDIDMESVRDKASILAPVPGGVGPITVAKLLENAVSRAILKSKT